MNNLEETIFESDKDENEKSENIIRKNEKNKMKIKT